MPRYIYEDFEDTEEFRDRLIELLRHNTNVEMGGYKLFDGSYNHAVQIPEEFADFIIALKRHERDVAKPKRLLEIGFAQGITNTLLNKFFNFEEIVAVDVFMGPAAGDMLAANLRFKNLTLVCGDSTAERAVRTATFLGPYDIVFIDGDHSYEGVMKDFENYGGLVAENGILVLHDIATPGTGVPQAWQEITGTGNYDTEEFICTDHQRPFGIGIARLRDT
jgi:predicted O-methyltransferase YrrM